MGRAHHPRRPGCPPCVLRNRGPMGSIGRFWRVYFQPGRVHGQLFRRFAAGRAQYVLHCGEQPQYERAERSMGSLRAGSLAGKRSPHLELRTAMGGASGIHGEPGRHRQLRSAKRRCGGSRHSPEQNRTVQPAAAGQLQRLSGFFQCLLSADEKYIPALFQCGNGEPGSLVAEPAEHLLGRLRSAYRLRLPAVSG